MIKVLSSGWYSWTVQGLISDAVYALVEVLAILLSGGGQANFVLFCRDRDLLETMGREMFHLGVRR